MVSNRRTRWRATSGLEFAPLEGTFLTRSSPAMLQAQPVVMRLEDDVPPGSHTVTLRLRGTSQRLFLRAFSWTEP